MQASAQLPSPLDDDQRKNRFNNHPTSTDSSAVHRERAASQPPRSSDQPLVTSPIQPFSAVASRPSPWLPHRLISPTRSAHPQPVSLRSPSFNAQTQAKFSSTMRDRAFPSTFEDDETEEELFVPPSLSRSRTVHQDANRSRSQSLATGSARPIASPYFSSALQNWSDVSSLRIPSPYGDIKPPGNNRHITIRTSTSPSEPIVGNGYTGRQNIDVSNMSPFVRDVGQILLDDGSAFRELWAGMHVPRDENGGGGNGTTSRRHSVSVVQPRRNIVGFNVLGNDDGDNDSSRPPGLAHSSLGGRRGLMISDDDLASDLGMLEINPRNNNANNSQHQNSSTFPPSQPASLPIYAPISRSPASRDVLSPYQPQTTKLSVPSSSPFISRGLHSPSDMRGTSPTVDLKQRLEFTNGGSSTKRQSPEDEFARFIHGQGLPYVASTTTQRETLATCARVPSLTSPIISPNGRVLNLQQEPLFSPQQRRPTVSVSIEQGTLGSTQLPPQQPSIAEVGKGLPLRAVPSSWPLFIVEFKAGRTDLFYCGDTRLARNLRVGDLVIVEADRGRDLGKVVNDGITVEHVEAFQRNQAEKNNSVGSGGGFGFGGVRIGGAGHERGGEQGEGDQPISPCGPGNPIGTRKDINPKMIYAKAQPQDVNMLMMKLQDEVKALQLCQSKVRAKKLPMEVVDAEYQWDRRKLTFYFVAEKRIDFRELVRELFRLYKTRIWMASLQGGMSFEE